MIVMNMLFCILRTILSESQDNEMGFMYISEDQQEMFIKSATYFRKIESAFLMEKTNSKNSTDYVNTKDLKSSTRYIKDPKEYNEFVERRRKVKPEDYSYHEIKTKEFNYIFISMGKIPKNGNKLYAINLKLSPKGEITTNSFMYDKEEKRWKFCSSPNDSGKYSNIFWIAAGSCSLLIIGFLLYNFL